MSEGNDTLTGSVDKDGTLVVKDAAGAETRYTKESDLLALKGSRETAEAKIKELEAAQATGGAELKTELETVRQGKLQAEAKISGLEGEIAKGTATAAELATAKAELETAKTSGEGLGNKLLELQRTLIISTYGVPVATVEKKTLQELEVYAEALAAVTGKALGNYAAGGGGGGTNLDGKTPMELARIAYETSSAK